MLGYYIFVAEAVQDRMKHLIKEAEVERQMHEFLKAHPECKTSSRIRAFIGRLIGHSDKSDDNGNAVQTLQKDAG
jgi:hypothetical protein